jgi:hypothetical protein
MGCSLGMKALNPLLKGLPIDAFPINVWVDSPRHLDFFEDGSTEQVDINGVKVKV